MQGFELLYTRIKILSFILIPNLFANHHHLYLVGFLQHLEILECEPQIGWALRPSLEFVFEFESVLTLIGFIPPKVCNNNQLSICYFFRNTRTTSSSNKVQSNKVDACGRLYKDISNKLIVFNNFWSVV